MRFVKASDIRLKKRSRDSHKGQNGELLIIGGSEDYVGCLALAGLAALRTGADWVTIAAPEKVGWAIHCLTPDLVVKKFKCNHFTGSHVNNIVNLSKKFDAVAIGSGIGLKSASFVRKVVRRVNKPIVIDADGVKAVSLKDARNSILTPHKKEFELLLKNSRVNEKGLQKSLRDNVVLVKGRIDRIISKGKARHNKTGNEGMAKGGTGDVLAGLAAGFLCQGYSSFDSACWAAYINGAVGDRLKKKKGYSFIASDMVEDIKKVFGKKGLKNG